MKLGASWQTTTADLALILFLVVSSAKPGGKPKLVPPSAPAPETTSAAIYRPSASLSLNDWLAGQGRDRRLTASVVVGRSANSNSLAVQQGLAMMAIIERSGRPVRMVVRKAAADDVSVVLGYDGAAGTALAMNGS